MSYLSQTSSIPKNFTARKAISLSVPSTEIEAFIDDPIIARIINTRVGDISTGDLRYLEIKIVLTKHTPFILLDEPYVGVAPYLIEKINELIAQGAKSKGIILTDHNYRNVIQIATHLTLLKDGKLHHLNDRRQLLELGYLTSDLDLL